jgi:hypothetical protein
VPGWVGLGRSGPAGLPGVAQLGSWPLSFIFFFCFLFFYSDFCFEFLKEFFYSDLNKVKADHFWFFFKKMCSENINQRFSDKMEK